jgi:hypothetical protein
MEGESMLHDFNSQQSFRAPSETKRSDKNMGAHDQRTTRSINLQAWLAQWSSLVEAFGMTVQPDR